MMEAWKGSHFARILRVSTAPREPCNPIWSHASKCTPTQIDPGVEPTRVVESVYPKSIDMPERFDVSHTGLWQSGSITIVEGV